MTTTDGKPYVVRQTRSVVKPGTFGGNHPLHSAISDHVSTIRDLLVELRENNEIGYSEFDRISRTVREVGDWAHKPVRDDVDAYVEANKKVLAEIDARKAAT